VFVDRRAGGLDDEGILAAGILFEAHIDLAVGEARDRALPLGNAEVGGNLLAQPWVGRPAEEFQPPDMGFVHQRFLIIA